MGNIGLRAGGLPAAIKALLVPQNLRAGVTIKGGGLDVTGTYLRRLCTAVWNNLSVYGFASEFGKVRGVSSGVIGITPDVPSGSYTLICQANVTSSSSSPTLTFTAQGTTVSVGVAGNKQFYAADPLPLQLVQGEEFTVTFTRNASTAGNFIFVLEPAQKEETQA